MAHLLDNGDLKGEGSSPVGIQPEDMTPEVWDYIFYKDAKMPQTKVWALLVHQRTPILYDSLNSDVN